MTEDSALGYLAAGLVFVAFWMRGPVKLRLFAIASNLAFLIYGLRLGLTPVVALHGALLPVNVWRLTQMIGPEASLVAAALGSIRSGAGGGRQVRKPDGETGAAAAATTGWRPHVPALAHVSSSLAPWAAAQGSLGISWAAAADGTQGIADIGPMAVYDPAGVASEDQKCCGFEHAGGHARPPPGAVTQTG